MQEIPSVVAQFHGKYKPYVAMQTILHVVTICIVSTMRRCRKILSGVAQSHRNYKRYVAMQTIPHVVDYLYSLVLRDDAVNSARSCPEF